MSSIIFYSFIILISLTGLFLVGTIMYNMQDKMNKLHHRIAGLDHAHAIDEEHTLEHIIESDMRIDALEAKNKILLKFLNTSWTEVLKDTAPKISIQEAIDAHFTEDEAEVPNEHWYKKGFLD